MARPGCTECVFTRVELKVGFHGSNLKRILFQCLKRIQSNSHPLHQSDSFALSGVEPRKQQHNFRWIRFFWSFNSPDLAVQDDCFYWPPPF